MPNALVTGAPELVPDLVMALKSAGFAILAVRDQSPSGEPMIVVGDDRAPEGSTTPPRDAPGEPGAWWRYAEVDRDLGFADWRDSILCLASPPGS